MLRRILPTALIVLVLSVLAAFPALATDSSSNVLNLQASNYCLSCHSYGDARLENVTAWTGGIAHNQISPCPAMMQITEEVYYTERLMLAIDRASEQAPASADLSRSESRLLAANQNYSRLLDTPVTSLDAFTSEAKMVRFDLGKVYSTVNQAIEKAKRTRVLWAAVAVSALVGASLVWGWINANKALRNPHLTPQKGLNFYFSRAVFLLLVFGLFALPIFRLPSQAVEMPTPEEQERQAVLDETGRAAQTADRELSRAWALAQIGALWAEKDASRGEAILEDALAAAQTAKNNTSALWGLSQNAWEAGYAVYASDAALVVSNLDAVRGRAWGQRLIAEAWLDVDPDRAREILAEALALTEAAVYPYQQLDLRALAVTWAKLDPVKGAAIARRISDPALRSWAFRELAVITGDDDHFVAAVEAARLVNDPVQRAHALREVDLFDEALDALQDVEGPELAYALADLTIASGDSAFAAEISSEFPAAQALAYLGVGDYQKAWDSAAEIADPFEQARAQAVIAAAWENTEAAAQIANPLFSDRALRDISLKTGNPDLASEIQDSYYRVQALIAAGQFDAAWESAEALKDGYPLVALGTAWAERDPEAAAQVVLALTREADKAEVLRAIAVATGDPADFESALGMALAARVRGDALSPVQASLDLAAAFESSPTQFEAAISQAYDAARKINIIY